MKKFVLTLAVYFALVPLFAQSESNVSDRFDVQVNVGATFTFIPEFRNYVFAANGMVVPGYIHPSNARSLSVSEGSSSSKSRMGWSAGAEVYYRLPQNYAISVGAGVKKMRFDYNTTGVGQSTESGTYTVNMDDINARFGKTDLLYLQVTPINVSKQFLGNKLTLQAGPVLDFLLKDETVNTVVVYYTSEAYAQNRPDEAFFDTIGDMRKFIWGANLSASWKVAAPVSIKVSAQYYFNSLYKDKAYDLDVEKVSPFVLQAGVSLSPFAF
jgi:hypothetical protein